MRKGPERLSDIGEFALIERIKNKTTISRSVVKGMGDDCAVIRYKKDKHMLFTTDMIIEDVHFRVKTASPEAIGHKALAVNISDIAACGGIPKWAVISAGLPANSRYDYIHRLYKGVEALAKRFNIDIVGGDTNSSKKLILSIALIGEVEKECLVLRSGAADKDIIVLSGPLYEKPDDLTFLPQLKEARHLVKSLKVNSMIDISDGFLSDLNHILEESKRSAIIYESLIPYKAESKPLYEILNQGEQFKLIATIARNEVKRLPRGFYTVGEIIGKGQGIIYVSRHGKRKKVSPGGYGHF
jgi:thiamine-monophosphate kinase